MIAAVLPAIMATPAPRTCTASSHSVTIEAPAEELAATVSSRLSERFAGRR